MARRMELHHRAIKRAVSPKESEVLITIGDLTTLRGALPPRALRLVEEWEREHLEELTADWQRARAGEPILPIAPLA